MKIWEKLAAWWSRRKTRALHNILLKKYNFIVFCPKCRAMLNEQRCEDVGDGVYRYECPCGQVTDFDFNPPVPICLSTRSSTMRGPTHVG